MLPVLPIAMMNHECRIFAATTAAEAVPREHTLAQSTEKA